jgi:hypothetical protein
MNIKRTWVVVGATIGVAGFAGAGIAMASDDVELQDPRHAPVVQLTGDSANSPNAPGAPVKQGGSADSAADSPGEAAPPPPPAPAKQAPAPAKVASADSPAPAPVRPPVHSANSGNADSGNSGSSADSGD